MVCRTGKEFRGRGRRKAAASVFLSAGEEQNWTFSFHPVHSKGKEGREEGPKGLSSSSDTDAVMSKREREAFFLAAFS